MNTKTFLPILIVLVLNSACNSTPQDGSKGISITENGLSASRVYLTSGKEETDNRTFYYGRKVYTNFVDLKGFIEENGIIYPQMSMFIISQEVDTIMQHYNLFGDVPEGIDAADPSINSNMTLARPIYSNKSYSMHNHITDAKGNASMVTKMNFELIPDSKIKVVSNGLAYSEAYIYSDDKDEVIDDGMFSFFENLRFDFQDLNGYVMKDGAIHLGMSIKVIDNNSEEILNMTDIFGDPIEDENLLKEGVSATLIVKEGQVANPLKWQVRIWDKNSDAKLRAQAEISVKK